MATMLFPSCDNVEATTWKRQFGSDNVEATTWKRNVENSFQMGEELEYELVYFQRK